MTKLPVVSQLSLPVSLYIRGKSEARPTRAMAGAQLLFTPIHGGLETGKW